MALWDKLNQIMGNTSNNNAPAAQTGNNTPTAQTAPSGTPVKTIHDPFYPTLGLGASTTFAEDALILGGTAYPYPQLQSIKLISKPSSSMFQGVAQAVTDNGKVLTLAFVFSDTERFLRALNFADEKINAAHGTAKNYKYLLQSAEGSKLEVYDDYAQLYYLSTGVKNLVSNTIQSGGSTTTLFFNQMEIQVVGTNQNNKFEVLIKHGNGSCTLYLNPEDEQTARTAVDYIVNSANTNSSAMQTPQILQAAIPAAVGSAKRFTLQSQTLDVPENEDVFNTYRLKFKEIASECADCARSEFNKRVRDLTSYLDFFPYIYGYYLTAMIDKAVQVIIAEGIWTETVESFMQLHTANFHLAMDDLAATVKSVELTVQNNQASTANFMSYIPNLVGGGFGLKGAAKGIATATAFNVVRDSAASSLIKSAASINQAQQVELYNRVNFDILFEHVFLDYWRVFLTLVNLLKNNGKDIWIPSDNSAQQANNIFKNLSNPAFPQAQIASAFINILQICPYNIEYHRFMVSHFGENSETIAIKDYFGYLDFNNPRMC